MKKVLLLTAALFVQALAFSAPTNGLTCEQYQSLKPTLPQSALAAPKAVLDQVNGFCALPENASESYASPVLDAQPPAGFPGFTPGGSAGQPGYCGLVQTGCKMYWWWSPIAADLCVKFYGC